MALAASSIFILAFAGLVSLSRSQIALKNASFSLRSTVFRQFSSEKPYWIEVDERYSQDQRRARIDYKIKQTDGIEWYSSSSKASIRFRGSFVYDSKRKTGIGVSNHVCAKASLDEITTTLGLYFPSEDDGIDEHIVGPARLLFFIDKHRNRMELFSTEPIRSRNMPSLMYKYDYHDQATGSDVQFNIYYSELSNAVDKEKAIPTQVTITMHNTLIIVDYWEPEMLVPNSAKHLRRFESLSEHSAVDLFAYKLATGCSEALQDLGENLFDSDDAATLRQFSFQASIKSYTIVGSLAVRGELFVAYDKDVNSIRVDSLTDATSSVFNIHLNRAYRLRDDRPKQTIYIARPDGGFDTSPDPRSKCIVTNVYDPQSAFDEQRFRLAKLLLGSEKFVYMGQGQVHGIDAIIYEASDVILPFWLEREIPYHDKEKSYSRDPVKGLTGLLEQGILDLVVYLDAQAGEHRILMIDINHFDKERTKMFGKTTIYIDNFYWKLDNQSPTGERASQLFSLVEDCSVDVSENRYAQVSLLLERSEPLDEADSLLDIATIRELSLLARLQKRYNIPVSMVFDLETRVRNLKSHIPYDTNSISQLQASFRLARHSESFVSLKFLGFGSRKLRLTSGEGVLQVQSFEECFLEAASRDGDINFGFQHEDKVCLFDNEVVKALKRATLDGSIAKTSKLFTKKPETVEVYQIERETKKDFYDNGTEIMKVMQKISLPGLSRERESVQFVVKAVHLDHRNGQSAFGDGTRTKEGRLEGEVDEAKRAGVIHGLGLVRDRSSRQIELSDDKLSIPEERCHTACLIDPECRLYSVCHINLETVCTLSSTNITGHLKDIIALKMREEEAGHGIVTKLSIQLSNLEPLELTKHPNCRIKLKNYLESFLKPVNRLQKIAKRRIHAVDGIGKCAEMVTMRNIKTLQEDTDRMPHVLSLISAAEGDSQALDTRNLHAATLKGLVNGFYYFDKSVYQGIVGDSRNFRDFIMKQVKELDGIENLDSVSGFCFFGEESSEEEDQAIEKIEGDKVNLVSMYISFEYYPFKFKTFYERHHGIRVIADFMSTQEHQAFKKFSRGEKDSISEADRAIMKSFLDRGENIQVTLASDLDKCAELCFTEEKGPWPGCRSFDVLTSNNGAHTNTMCFLNSITLKQAFVNQRYDLIRETSGFKIMVDHYEPRPGLVEAEAELAYDVNLLASLSLIRNKVRIHVFGVMCILVLSTIGGFALGYVVCSKFLAARELKRQQREETLVPAATGIAIEFDNQVNSKGEIGVY